MARGLIERQLSSALNQSATIGDFETNLVSRIRLTGVRIPGEGTDTGGIYLSRLEVHYRLWPLVSGTLDLRSIQVDTLSVAIERDSLHGFNLALLDSLLSLPDTAAADTGGEPMILQLGVMRVQQLDISFNDQVTGTEAFLPDIQVQTDSAGEREYNYSLTSDTGLVRFGGITAGDLNIAGRAAHSDSVLWIDSLVLAASGLRLVAAGRYPLAEEQTVELEAALTGDPSALIAAVEEEYDLSGLSSRGKLALSAQVSGPVDSATIRVDAKLPSVTYDSIEMRDPRFRAHLIADTAVIDTASAEILGGSLGLRGKFALDTSLAGSATLSLQAIDLSALLRTTTDSFPPYDGRLDGTAELRMQGSDWTMWEAEANLRAVRMVDGVSDAVDLTATFAQGQLDAAITHPEFNARAAILIRDSTLSGKIAADIRRVASLAEWAAIGPAEGAVTLSADLGGTLGNPSATADITGRQILILDIPADTLDARVRWSDSTLAIESFKLQGHAQSIDPDQPLLGVDSLIGSLEYDARLSGSLDSLQGDIAARADSLQFGQLGLDSASLDILLDGRTAEIRSLTVYRDSLAVLVDGRYNQSTGEGTMYVEAYAGESGEQFAEDHADGNGDGNGATLPDNVVSRTEAQFRVIDSTSISIEIAGEALDLSRFSPLLSDSIRLSGSAAFRVSASGPMTDPDQMTATVELNALSPTYNNIALDSARIKGTFEAGVIRLDDFAAVASDQWVTAQGSAVVRQDSLGNWMLADNAPTQGSLRMANFDLSTLAPFLPTGVSAEGIAELDVSWEGPAGLPSVAGEMSLDSGRIAWVSESPDGTESEESITGITIHGTIVDSTLRLERADAEVAGRRLALQGTLTLAGQKEVRPDLTLLLDSMRVMTTEGVISAERLDFVAQIDSLDLDIFAPFTPDIDSLGGVLFGSVSLSGTAADPVIDGRIEASGVMVKHSMIDQPFTDGRMVASFTRDEAVIDTMSIHIEEGEIGGNGRLAFDSSGITDIDMRLRSGPLEFTVLENSEVRTDGLSLEYRPDGEYFLLTGAVDFGETRYKEDFELTAVLPWTQEVQQVETELPTFLARTRMDIRLTGSDSLWIDNNLAHLRVDAELQIGGFLTRPQLGGRLSTEEGYVLYLDRKFEVTEGVAFFTDPVQINPDVTLAAESEVTSYEEAEPTHYQITLTVTGRLQSPTVELTSDPPLSRADIVSVLTLGATRGELAGETGSILQERAEAIASQQLSGFASEQVGNLLGLDRVTVTGNIFNASDTTGPQLVAAERISDNVTLTYRTTVGHLNDQEVSVNWQLSRVWMFEGITNRTGNASLNFTYKLRYR